MSSLDLDLGKIQEAADLDMSTIVEEGANAQAAARVRSARNADDAGERVGNLLDNLFSDSDAENEVAERKRRKKEAEEKKLAEEKAKEEKERLEAEKRLAEENKRIQEMKAHKEKMLADLAKQRRIEEVGYDEEEVARQKAEEEARIRAEEEAEARELEENERLIAELKANQAELDAKNRAAAEKKRIEEIKAQRKKNVIMTIAAIAFLAIAGSLGYYFATKKAPDFYVLKEDYQSISITFQDIKDEPLMAANVMEADFVIQEKKVDNSPRRPTGPRGPKKEEGIINTNVFGTNSIVK